MRGDTKLVHSGQARCAYAHTLALPCSESRNRCVSLESRKLTKEAAAPLRCAASWLMQRFSEDSELLMLWACVVKIASVPGVNVAKWWCAKMRAQPPHRARSFLDMLGGILSQTEARGASR